LPNPIDLSSLDVPSLSARLHALAGEERSVQAEFLRHLDALDRRRGFADLGYPSLWEYCLRALYLREAAAGRRIGAMRVLRRFPELEAAIRDGRLCLSTLCALGPVLTEENVADLTTRAAFKTKTEVEEIVVSLKPRHAPADGVRRIAVPFAPSTTTTPPPEAMLALNAPTPATTDAPSAPGEGLAPARPISPDEAATFAKDPAAAHLAASNPPRGPDLRPVADATWSLRVTLDADAKRDLETLTHLLSHRVPSGDLAAVMKEALRCAIKKHGKRRGAVAPERPRTPSIRAANEPTKPAKGSPAAKFGGNVAAAPVRDCALPVAAVPARDAAAAAAVPRGGDATPAAFPARERAIPAAVRREVWARDGGRCTFVAPDGTRCGSRWKLEMDHVDPRAFHGPPTAGNLRVRCRTHNILYAEQVFGHEQMARFRRVAEAQPRSSYRWR
jgi:hypothetical protein